MPAASSLVDDLHKMKAWLTHDLMLFPFTPLMDIAEPTELPLRYPEVLRVAEEFRAMALPNAGGGCVNPLLRASPSKMELKEVARQRYAASDLLRPRELAVLGSESAQIATAREHAREIGQVVIPLIQRRLGANQVSPLSPRCNM